MFLNAWKNIRVQHVSANTPPLAAGGKTLARGHVITHFHN
jgi:hypothetical protein